MESARGAGGSGECGAAGVCGWWPPDNLLLVTSSRARQRGHPAWAEDGDIAFSLVTKTKNNHQRTKGCGALGVTGSHRWWQWERVAGFMLHAVAQGQSSPEHFGLWVLSKAGTAAVLAGSRFPGAFLRTGQPLAHRPVNCSPKAAGGLGWGNEGRPSCSGAAGSCFQ